LPERSKVPVERLLITFASLVRFNLLSSKEKLMFRVYGDLQSGNCYKIKLLMSYLAIPHEWVHIDILTGETQTDEFLAKNPNGKIPVLEIAGGKYMAESNAILNYLAAGTEYLPQDNKVALRLSTSWRSIYPEKAILLPTG
jgi:glutathione S-transferase